MIAYLPQIYPDELVYSWFCRYYIYSGCYTHRMAMQDLYCKRSDNLSKEFIGNLNPEAKKMIEGSYPLEGLVLNHTMYPQYARFLSLERKKKALYHLGKDHIDTHHLFCILPRNEGEQHLKFCPLCVKEDRETYGETYWHRKHQIRNMMVCPKHRCKLVNSNVLAKSEQSYIFYPAEICLSKSEAVMEENQSVILFSSYLEEVFDAPVDLGKDISVQAVLHNGISRTKYLKPSGRSRYTKQLAEDLKQFYQEMGLHSISTIHQIQKILLQEQDDFSVVCQMAFFLGMKPEELTKSSLTEEQICREQDTHYMKGVTAIDWEQLDKETVPTLERLAKSIYEGTSSEHSRPERVSERAVCRELNLTEYQLKNMPKCQEILGKYAESYPESWARKIIWAYRNLKELGEPFFWTDIRNISGVKKRHFEEVEPYLVKHTDRKEAEEIVALIKGTDSHKDLEYFCANKSFRLQMNPSKK